eukprot:c12904_g1_i1.p1 GENE.c12904_g1_i1~~c12904_g1_i1.p1  ORF type:complete len:602 (+),score=124.14 c12904_g1_i1:142-1806(+)
MVEDHGWTLAHIAAKAGSVDVLEALAEFGAPLFLPTNNGQGTHPIHLACAAGSVDATRFFIKRNKRELFATDALGYSPLTYAALETQMEVFDFLVAQGADLHVRDRQENTLAHLVCANGNSHVMYRLYKLGVSLDDKNPSERTPLMVACAAGHPHVVALLIHFGANLKSMDKDGFTPMHWACTQDSPSCAALLYQMGADVNAKIQPAGMTPLHLACRTDKFAVVEYLISIGADTTIRDEEGKTPLEYVADIEKILRVCPNFQSALLVLRRASRLSQMLRWSFLGRLFDGFSGGGTSSMVAFAMQWFIGGFGFNIYRSYILPNSAFVREYASLVYAGLACQLVMWTMFLATWLRDPGFFDECSASLKAECFDELAKSAEQLPVEKSKPQLPKHICHTCFIDRPRRSKHCPVCRRCVNHMDHHCAFVGNCIGENNWVTFYLYVLFVIASSVICAGTTVLFMSRFGLDGWLLAQVPVIGFFALPTSGLFGYQSYLAATGLLANEHSNWYRYDYMMNDRHTFHNPFDRGCIGNIFDRFCPEQDSQPNYRPVTSADDNV